MVSVKKHLSALLCAALLFPVLSGCASLLNREYSYSAPHVEYPVTESATVLQAENYQGLVNAILYFVTEHEESGLIHLSNYPGSVGTALIAACREVCAEDPLGAYAVEGITHTYEYVVSYYEVSISISYAHTAEEVAAIVPAAGSTAIRQTISSHMAAFADKCVFRVNYFTGDASSLLQLSGQTLLDTPLAALARPELSVTLYPDSGTSRIVEVAMTWPRPAAELAEESSALEQRALALLEDPDASAEVWTPEDLLTTLRRASRWDPEGGETAYSVLVEGRGNDRGMALALRLLCQLADLDATVVQGSLNGSSHFWLIVPTDEGFRHLDPTDRDAACSTDSRFSEAGYIWDESRYPACPDYTAPSQPEDEPPAETDPVPEEPDPAGEDGIQGKDLS